MPIEQHIFLFIIVCNIIHDNVLQLLKKQSEMKKIIVFNC